MTKGHRPNREEVSRTQEQARSANVPGQNEGSKSKFSFIQGLASEFGDLSAKNVVSGLNKVSLGDLVDMLKASGLRSHPALTKFADQNGNPHLHILIDRFIEQAWLSAAWDAVGGGRIVDIRFVDVHRVSRYLSKHLTVDLFLSAPMGIRRVTCSRGIVLLERRVKTRTWRVLAQWATQTANGSQSL